MYVVGILCRYVFEEYRTMYAVEHQEKNETTLIGCCKMRAFTEYAMLIEWTVLNYVRCGSQSNDKLAIILMLS